MALPSSCLIWPTYAHASHAEQLSFSLASGRSLDNDQIGLAFWEPLARDAEVCAETRLFTSALAQAQIRK